MKLESYDVTIQLSDPNDKGTKMKTVLEKVPREKVLTVKIPLAGLLKMFEESVVDNTTPAGFEPKSTDPDGYTS